MNPARIELSTRLQARDYSVSTRQRPLRLRMVKRDTSMRQASMRQAGMRQASMRQAGMRQAGSTLVWTMVTSIVLLMITGIIVFAITMSHGNTLSADHDTQAYYTARSVDGRILDWLKNTPGASSDSLGLSSYTAGGGVSATPGQIKVVGVGEASEQQQFIANLIEQRQITQSYDSQSLGGAMGSADVVVSINDDNTRITIQTTARYGEQRHTITSYLQSEIDMRFTYGLSSFSLQPKFQLDRYDGIIKSINAGTDGFATDLDPVNIQFGGDEEPKGYTTGYSSKATDKRDWNAENRATLDSYIEKDDMSREATMREDTVGLTGNNYDTGPRDQPMISDSLATKERPVAAMMMPTPANGKLMINPISISKANNYNFTTALNTGTTNCKNAEFAITDTANKSVKLRLANSGEGKRTTGFPKFAWFGLDFRDNNNPYTTIPVPGAKDTAIMISDPYVNDSEYKLTPLQDEIAFYPNSWKDCTIYLKDSASESIASTLVFGNYNRILEGWRLDWYGRVNYINYHWGYKNQTYELYNAVGIGESDVLKTYKDRGGSAFIPTYWGDKVSLYILDGAYTNEAAWIMQGVTIGNTKAADGTPNGVIYSNRSLKIGGAFTVSSLCRTFEGMASDLDGFDGNMGGHVYATDQWIQPTFHQAITNTDIVFGSTPGKTTNHEILHQDSGRGYEGRTLSILGGAMYVAGNGAGSKSVLTIDSEVKDGILVNGQVQPDGITVTKRSSAVNSEVNYYEKDNRMYIQPDELIVGSGGSVIIKGNANDHDNVAPTSIFVRSGGTLTLQSGAKVKAEQIIVEDGGVLNILGASRVTATIAVAHGGEIIISGGATIIGDVLVSGEMSLNGTLTLYPPTLLVDDPETAWDDSKPENHGVFIYNSQTYGVGSLVLGGTPLVLAPQGGGLHSLANMSGITGKDADNVFCDGHDPETNICTHFSVDSNIWIHAGTEGG